MIIHFKRLAADSFYSYPGYDTDVDVAKEFIDFPTKGLDISKYVGSSEGKSHSYDLYGVIHHFGSAQAGHYWATCRNSEDNKWYKFDDSIVSKASKEEIVADSAYVLFYKRNQ